MKEAEALGNVDEGLQREGRLVGEHVVVELPFRIYIRGHLSCTYLCAKEAG